MTTTTLFIDSRTKISGTHADFRVSLPEQVTLRGSRMRVDSIRTTDTITTVSARNKYAYFLDGAGGLTSVELGDAAYIGSTFATQLATKSGRSCTYLSATNSLQVAYAETTRIIWEDEELKSFPASAFPDDARPFRIGYLERVGGGQVGAATTRLGCELCCEGAANVSSVTQFN